MAKKRSHKQSGIPPQINKPFDPRIRTIGKGDQPLTRGHIRHAPNANPCFGRVGFLYNPSSISVNHSIALNQAGSEAQGSNANVDQKGNQVNIGDVSFPLLFDRTFEVWDRKKGYEPSVYGVYHDVAAFYALVGLTGAHADSTSVLAGLITGSGDQTITSAVYPIQSAVPTLVYAQLGASLKYYGQITGLSITYTHWSHDMIPMRCAIDVGISMLSDPNAGSRTVVKQKHKNNAVISKPATTLGGLLGAGQ